MKTKKVPEKTLKNECENASLNPLCTRRQVLIWGGISIVGLSTLSTVFAKSNDSPMIIIENARKLVVADPVLCVGCGRCELACTEFNEGKASPSLSRIKINRNLNFGLDGPTLWRKGHGNYGDGLVVQDFCKQCPHPVPCVSICPENAIVLSPENNARFVDQEKCIGCKMCLESCPWEMISYDEDTGRATKCHLCNGKPKCVEACPTGALTYTDWFDLTNKMPARKRKTTK